MYTKIVFNTPTQTDTEDDYKSREETHNITKKSVSTVGFRNNSENQNARPIALRSTKSFTGAIEELRFCNNLQRFNQNSINPRATPRMAPCPCGYYLRPAEIMPFRTRERNTFALHVVPPEVLHYHGYDFKPSQIAMFWKKDCRMFLWKGTKNSTDYNQKIVTDI